MQPTRGVYFLANDTVYDLTVAFLNSFRLYNPDMPLCMVPFSKYSDRVRGLAPRYRFSIFADDALLEECDAMCLALKGRKFGHLRKLALWNGPFEEALYLDVDTVLLESIENHFRFLKGYEVVTAYGGGDWVWKPSVAETGLGGGMHPALEINNSYILTRRDALPMPFVREQFHNCLAMKEHMVEQVKDQPFLSYMFIAKGVRMTTYKALIEQDASLKHPEWAGNPGGHVSGGAFTNAEGQQPFMLHWSGVWHQTAREMALRRLLCKFGMYRSSVSRNLPYRNLWNHYRWLHKA